MKLLLDENLPKKLKLDFSDHEIFTVADKGWNSKKNGELWALMIRNDFDVLLTFDKNLQFQQNFRKYPIAVIALDPFHFCTRSTLPLGFKINLSDASIQLKRIS